MLAVIFERTLMDFLHGQAWRGLVHRLLGFRRMMLFSGSAFFVGTHCIRAFTPDAYSMLVLASDDSVGSCDGSVICSHLMRCVGGFAAGCCLFEARGSRAGLRPPRGAAAVVAWQCCFEHRGLMVVGLQL